MKAEQVLNPGKRLCFSANAYAGKNNWQQTDATAGFSQS